MERNEFDMSESKTITLPKNIPLLTRISEAKRQISEWLRSLEKPFNHQTELLRLAKYSQYHKEYSYKYEIVRKGE